jgi:signal transduction histidine kinase
MDRTWPKLSESLLALGGRETLRALLVFGTLLVTLAGIAVNLAFRELDLQVVSRRLDLGRHEAERIAAAVAALGRSEGGIDFGRLRETQPALERVIHERIRQRPFILYVEVLDRFGGRFLFVPRSPETRPPLAVVPRTVEGWPGEDPTFVRAELRRGVVPEGEVRVGIAQDAYQRELAQLRRSLRLRVMIAALCGLGVLVLGLLYVMFLIRKNRRLEQSRLAAERRSYVGLLASGLAHEIRNPLNAMNMNLQMLEEELRGVPGLPAGDHHELLDSTKSEIKRLERLVNNFLAYARPSEPRFEPMDVNAVIREVARFLQVDFRQSHVALGLDLEPLLPTVELDETQFKQALLNLLVNARQVLQGGGTVTVRSRAGVGGDVEIEVQDDGPGIPAEARERVFEVFYSNRGGGTGLGLPIARQIVEGHGGRIELVSREGRGTTFRIRLPRRHGRAEAPAGAVHATRR